MTKYTFGKIALAFMVATGLAAMVGCFKENPNNYRKFADYNGCDAVAFLDADSNRRGLNIVCDDSLHPISLNAKDLDNDGRFDQVNLYNTPKGHFLEKVVDLNEAEKVFSDVKTNGTDNLEKIKSKRIGVVGLSYQSPTEETQ